MSGAGKPEPASALPAHVRPYHRTPEFTEASVPAGLLKSHATKAGTWGLVHVLAGELVLRFTDERRREAELRLRPGDSSGVIEPTISHEVRPLGPVRFFVEFHRVPA
ncbi:MAG TPA: DUF1971 domain-containing protein [Allosphingosinicella sp.]